MSAPTFEAVMEWRNLDHNAAQVRADSRDDLIIDGLRPDRQRIACSDGYADASRLLSSQGARPGDGQRCRVLGR